MTEAHRTPEYFRNSRKVRGILTPRINAGSHVPCVNCGRAVTKGQLWDVGHIIDAARGGSNAVSNMGAAHRRCNRSDGGKLGAAKTNRASRKARRLPSW